MNSLREKLTKLESGKPSDWKDNINFRRENSVWLKKSAAIAIKVLTALKVQKLSQKDLAQRMKISPQQVNKIVRGQENLTLETISNLESALSITIIKGISKPGKSAA
jgi:ribosome-binding protein aMBF1 (putative translation factor)